MLKDGYAIGGDHVDGILKDQSLVPTEVQESCIYSNIFFVLKLFLERILMSVVQVWQQLLPVTGCRPFA